MLHSIQGIDDTRNIDVPLRRRKGWMTFYLFSIRIDLHPLDMTKLDSANLLSEMS